MSIRGPGVLAGAAALLVAACSASVEPEGLAGEWLVELGSVSCSPTPVVSFSANRDWMLLWIEYFRPDSGMNAPLVSPALLEIDSRRLVLPAGPADRVEGPSFLPGSLCWDDAGQGVFLRSSGWRGAAESRWYRADIGPDSALVAVSGPPGSCRRPPEVEWQSHREAVVPAEVRGDLQVIRDGSRAVELRRVDGRLLVRHEALAALSDSMMIGQYAWSQSGLRLAYTLHEETSWRFGRPTRSFVLNEAGQPHLLGGQVYAFAWRGDEELLACASRPRVEGGGTGLKRWRFDAGDP